SERDGAGLAPASYAPALSAGQRAEVEAFLGRLRDGGFSPPTDGLPERALLSYLVVEGLVEECAAGVVWEADALARLRARILEHVAAEGPITRAEVRDACATSRKYAQALLEHLDVIGVTKRVGDARVAR